MFDGGPEIATERTNVSPAQKVVSRKTTQRKKLAKSLRPSAWLLVKNVRGVCDVCMSQLRCAALCCPKPSTSSQIENACNVRVTRFVQQKTGTYSTPIALNKHMSCTNGTRVHERTHTYVRTCTSLEYLPNIHTYIVVHVLGVPESVPRTW